MIENVHQILECNFLKDKARSIFGAEETELVTRYSEDGSPTPTSYIVKRKNEHGPDVERLIVLPSGGYTANLPNWTNAYPETHHATIEILGGVREGRAAFSQLKDCITFAHASRGDSTDALNVPYKETSAEEIHKQSLSSGTRCHVVKPDGFGFYHNLTNTSSDWLALKVEKHLRPVQSVDLVRFDTKTGDGFMPMIQEYYHAVQAHGDRLFHAQPELVKHIVEYPDKDRIIPPLIEMLKVYDAGRHEACTVFATLLQIAKKDSDVFLNHAQRALAEHNDVAFHLEQLVRKVKKSQPETVIGDAATEATFFATRYGAKGNNGIQLS